MPSKKRRRPTSPAIDEGAASPPRPLSLDGFHLIPVELQQLIISFACLHPTSSSRISLTPFAATDTATALNLCVVNREIGQWAQRLLYRDASITRPSALYALEQTLTANPALGGLIQRLHLGPQDILPAHWWPLSNAYVEPYSHDWPDKEGRGGPFTWIATSLDKSQLPSGYESRQAFPLHRLPEDSCKDIAIAQAIEAAKIRLGASLRADRDSMMRYTDIKPILAVQAALDLYLMKIRALEDENRHLVRLAARNTRVPQRCRDGSCSHYPALFIPFRTPPVPEGSLNEPPKGAYTLSRTQLLRYMARPGAVTDRFDHPLLFSRSRLKIYLMVPPGRGHPHYAPGRGVRYQAREQWTTAQGGFALHEWHEADRLRAEDPVSNAFLVNTATMISNLRSAKAVLALTPNLASLSLTGFLENAVGGGGNPRLPNLRRLSLGPPPVCWAPGLALQGLQLVEDLRIAGTALVASEIEVIKSTKPKLRSVEWSMKETLPSDMQLNITQTIQLLLKGDEADSASIKPSATPGNQQEGREGENVNDPQAESDSPPSLITKGVSHPGSNWQTASGQHALRVTAKLHPTDVAIVLASAPSEEIKAAWLGQGSRGSIGDSDAASAPRLLLRESRVPNGGKENTLRPSKDSRSRVWREFYEEGREWWSAGEAR